MADELRNQQAQQEAFAARQLAKELEQARIFVASMDRLAPEYANAAKQFGIKPGKPGRSGLFAKQGWEPRFKRGNISPETIGHDVPKDDPSRQTGPKRERGLGPMLYIFTDGSWSFVNVSGTKLARPQRMSPVWDYSYEAMREQLMRDLKARAGRMSR